MEKINQTNPEKQEENNTSPNQWEQIMSKVPVFNKIRAERAKVEAFRKEQKELESRLAAGKELIDSGSIKGHEEELLALLQESGKASNDHNMKAYEHVFVWSDADHNKSDPYYRTPEDAIREDHRSFSGQKWKDELIQKISVVQEPARESLRALAVYKKQKENQEAQQRYKSEEEKHYSRQDEDRVYRRERNSVENLDDSKRPRFEAPSSQNNPSTPERRVKSKEAPKDEEWRRKLQEGTSSLPDQGPNAFSPTFNEYPADPFDTMF